MNGNGAFFLKSGQVSFCDCVQSLWCSAVADPAAMFLDWHQPGQAIELVAIPENSGRHLTQSRSTVSPDQYWTVPNYPNKPSNPNTPKNPVIPMFVKAVSQPYFSSPLYSHSLIVLQKIRGTSLVNPDCTLYLLSFWFKISLAYLLIYMLIKIYIIGNGYCFFFFGLKMLSRFWK